MSCRGHVGVEHQFAGIRGDSAVSAIDFKRDHELRTFQQFCDAAALKIVRGTVCQPDPPAPDLIAELEGEGRVAFELVRLNDPDQLTRLSLMQQTPQFLQAEFAALPAKRHEDLSAKYADGIITIHFRGAVDLGLRRKALPFIWETLAAQPVGFTGKVDLWDLGAPDAVELIWVNRGKTPGGVPYFKTQTAGYVLPLVAVLERAAIDIFIVDPYIGADFVPRYLVHVRVGVKVRLLTRQYLAQLAASVEQLSKQHGLSIEIRRSKSHDRYVFIDGTECHHSSASFQDGGGKSAAMLSQVTDAFDGTKQIYETEWSGAVVVRAP
jgi:hypothetical protein